jgi:hypothetical protein
MAGVRPQSDRTKSYPATIQSGVVESRNLPSTRSFNRELFRVKAHWLVDLFPDELVVQEKTISVIHNELFVSFVETMPVRDIGRVVYVDAPIFAALRVIGKNTQHELHIKGLNKTRAIRAKEVIEGLLLEDLGAIEVPHWIEADKRRDMLAGAGRTSQSRAGL